jgi:hypothetical protein
MSFVALAAARLFNRADQFIDILIILMRITRICNCNKILIAMATPSAAQSLVLSLTGGE